MVWSPLPYRKIRIFCTLYFLYFPTAFHVNISSTTCGEEPKNCRTFTDLISKSIDKNVPIYVDSQTIEELIKLADDIKSQNPYEDGKIDLIVKMNQLIKKIINDNQ